MSSYDFYVLIGALREFIVAILPVLIIIAIGVVMLLGWRVWLKYRGIPHDVIATLTELKKRLQNIEQHTGIDR